MNTERHIPVLLQPVISLLDIHKGDVVIDATLGSAGMSEAFLKETKGNISLIGLDVDPEAIEFSRRTLGQFKKQITLVNENFRNLDRVLSDLNIISFDRIIFDLGWRIEQFREGKRGLSFMNDEPLLMTLGDPKKYSFTAFDIINKWSEEQIEIIIKAYGEERFSKRIARAIVKEREIKPIQTTFDLVKIIEGSIPKKFQRGKISPSTKTFQALRMAVNDELESLSFGLEKAFTYLSPGGRMAVISFHSGEDRIVKRFMREKVKEGTGLLVNKKPIEADEDELIRNPKARSAKLRVIEKNEN